MEELHYPKNIHNGELTINGYTIKEMNDYMQHIAKIKETERKKKLEDNNMKFSRKLINNTSDISYVMNEIDKIKKEELDSYIF